MNCSAKPYIKLTISFLTSQYLNIKLTDISVTDPEKYPHMVSMSYRLRGIYGGLKSVDRCWDGSVVSWVPTGKSKIYLNKTGQYFACVSYPLATIVPHTRITLVLLVIPLERKGPKQNLLGTGIFSTILRRHIGGPWMLCRSATRVQSTVAETLLRKRSPHVYWDSTCSRFSTLAIAILFLIRTPS